MADRPFSHLVACPQLQITLAARVEAHQAHSQMQLIAVLCATLSFLDYAAAGLHHQRVQAHQAQSVDPPTFHQRYHSLSISLLQLLDYITNEFKRIKRKQAELLGMGKRPDGTLPAEEEKREANRLEPATPRPPQAKL